MIKNITISALTAILVVLLIFHPLLGLIAAYLLLGVAIIHLIGTDVYTRSSFRWPTGDNFTTCVVFLVVAFIWPLPLAILLTDEGIVKFHKPITFHKPKKDEAGQENS